MNVQGSVLTFDSIKEKYPPSKYILLMPHISRHLLTVKPMWSLDVATIKFDPNNKNHCYWPTGAKGFSLTKYAIQQLAAAADASVMVKRVDDHMNPMYALYEGYTALQTPSGGTRGQSRTCAWEGDALSLQVRREATAFIESEVKHSKNSPTKKQIEDAINNRYEEQWIREQIYGKRGIETGAGNRAVRVLLGIQDTYSKTDLTDKEFAVIRFVFTPDLEDREVKLLVVSAALRAQRMLYPTPEEPMAITGSVVPPPNVEPVYTESDDRQEAAGENNHPTDLGLATTMDTDTVNPELEQERQAQSDLNWDQVAGYVPGLVLAVSKASGAVGDRLSRRLSVAIAEQDAEEIAQLVDFCETAGLMEDTK